MFVTMEWEKLVDWSRERGVGREGLGRLPKRRKERELLGFP